MNIQVKIALNENFGNHFSKNLAPVLDVSDFWGSFAPWVLVLKLESYLSYVKKVLKDIEKYRPINFNS